MLTINFNKGGNNMHKKIISCVAALVFVLGLAAVSFAADWAEIIYGGYVTVTLPNPVNVLADTGIWVFNPNINPITCNISHVIDKHGNIILTNAPLLDGGKPITSIPHGGHGWTTLGQLLTLPGIEIEDLVGTNKLLFRVVCTGQAGRAPVVQVKEVIYTEPQVIEPEPGTEPWNPIYIPTLIREWAETSLGGPWGTGKFLPVPPSYVGSGLSGEIIYGGYVSVVNTPDPLVVRADTGIWVFNPNTFPIQCTMQVLNKYGVLVWSGPLYDGGQQVSSIPRGGHVWTTLGMVPGIPQGTAKYTFRLLFSASQNFRAPIVEVKEVIYTMDKLIYISEGHVVFNPIYEPTVIQTWAETSLGGPVGTGKFLP
jgi:hypothetical protein